MQPPCKDCAIRKLGCHSTCEKYIAFDKSRKEISEKRLAEQKLNSDVWLSSRHHKRKKRW